MACFPVHLGGLWNFHWILAVIRFTMCARFLHRVQIKMPLLALRRKNIRKDLEQNMEHRDTKTRAHRKNQGAMNGAMSFVEMGKLMNTSWKSCDDFAKSVFSELSEEGRKHYHQRVHRIIMLRARAWSLPRRCPPTERNPPRKSCPPRRTWLEKPRHSLYRRMVDLLMAASRTKWPKS